MLSKKKKKGFHKNFSGDLQKKIKKRSSKNFFKQSPKNFSFNNSKNSAVLEPRTGQFSGLEEGLDLRGQGQGLQNLSSRTPPLLATFASDVIDHSRRLAKVANLRFALLRVQSKPTLNIGMLFTSFPNKLQL